MFIYISGVSGSGKTKLIKETIKFAAKKGVKMERVDEISELCKLAGVKNVLELQDLPEDLLISLREELREGLYQIDKSNPDIIRLIDGRFVFDFTEEKKNNIQKFDKERVIGIIIIFLSVQNILSRRKNFQKKDSQDYIQALTKEQKMEIDASILHAKAIDVNFSCVGNDDPNITAAAKHIFLLSRAWFSNYLNTKSIQ